MKKLILILSLVLACLCVIACIPRTQVGTPTNPTQSEPATGSQPESTVPTTQTPIQDGWHTEGENRYYYLDGQPVTGWQEIDGQSRYFLADGAMAHGFVDLDGSRYYFTEGCIVTGWVGVNEKWYYFDENGVMVTGWLERDDGLQQEGGLYYFKADGAMARGCVQIDGVNHYFTSTGAPILVLNPWNALPADYEPDLVELSSYYATANNRVDRSCYDALIEMMDACNREEPRVCVLSGYRSLEQQTKNYNKKVKYFLNQGYDQEEAERLAAQIVAVPGTSEHHSGLAVDIIDTRLWALEEEQADLPAQQWLMEHCWEYGFILRYPADKTEVTGIIYEPWHYRYVGKELAKELHELGLTLEEYLTMLTEQENA